MTKIAKDKRLLTLMVIFFPTILIVAVTGVQEDYILRAILQILIAIYQVIVMKNLLDEYYGTD